MAMDVEVIWVESEQEYFCERGWTGDSQKSPSGKSGHALAWEIAGDAPDPLSMH
jgi:hypothetical protein